MSFYDICWDYWPNFCVSLTSPAVLIENSIGWFNQGLNMLFWLFNWLFTFARCALLKFPDFPGFWILVKTITKMIDTKSSVPFHWSSVMFPLATNNHLFSLPVGPLYFAAIGPVDRGPKKRTDNFVSIIWATVWRNFVCPTLVCLLPFSRFFNSSQSLGRVFWMGGQREIEGRAETSDWAVRGRR